MTNLERMLVSVAASVAAGCKSGVDRHLAAARAAGLADEAIALAIAVASAARRDAAHIMERHALAQLGRDRAARAVRDDGDGSRLRVLVSVGAASALCCTAQLERQLDLAGALGISPEELGEVADLAGAMVAEAASEVKGLVDSARG